MPILKAVNLSEGRQPVRRPSTCPKAVVPLTCPKAVDLAEGRRAADLSGGRRAADLSEGCQPVRRPSTRRPSCRLPVRRSSCLSEGRRPVRRPSNRRPSCRLPVRRSSCLGGHRPVYLSGGRHVPLTCPEAVVPPPSCPEAVVSPSWKLGVSTHFPTPSRWYALWAPHAMGFIYERDWRAVDGPLSTLRALSKRAVLKRLSEPHGESDASGGSAGELP